MNSPYKLIHAIQANNLSEIEYLLMNKPETFNYSNPLMIAVAFGTPESLKILLDLGEYENIRKFVVKAYHVARNRNDSYGQITKELLLPYYVKA